MLILTDEPTIQSRILEKIVYFSLIREDKKAFSFFKKLVDMMNSNNVYKIDGVSIEKDEFNVLIYYSFENYEKGDLNLIGGLVHDSVNGTWDIHT
jgi:hypothetical protein